MSSTTLPYFKGVTLSKPSFCISLLDFEGVSHPASMHAKQQAHAFLRQADGSKGALQLAVPLQAAWLD